MVDVHLAHPGAFHHRVEGDEVFRDERDQIQRVILDGGLGFAEALEALEIGQQAEGHHLERLGVEVAEKEPIRPDVVEVAVELTDLRNGVEFVGVVVPAVHQELEAAHHRGQVRAFRQRVWAEGLEEVVELALAHLLPAEHYHLEPAN